MLCAMCSVKDRIAFNMIKRAEEQGIISPERTTLVRRPACTVLLLWLSMHCSCDRPLLTASCKRDKAGPPCEVSLHVLLQPRMRCCLFRWSRRAATRAWAWRTSRPRAATASF
jgi:hypothetical protein